MFLSEHFHFSPKYKYVFISTAKVACSSLKNMLQHAEIGSAPGGDKVSSTNEYGYSDYLLHIHDPSRWGLLHPAQMSDVPLLARKAEFAFAFVRNPYARVLSAYIDKIRNNKARRELFMGSNAKEISFVDFLRTLIGRNPAEMDGHWRPQYHHLKSYGVDLNMVGCLENFSRDVAHIIKHIDENILSFSSDVFEHSTGSSRLPEYYTAEAVDIVKRVYAEDFAKLGYSDNIASISAPPAFGNASAFRLVGYTA